MNTTALDGWPMQQQAFAKALLDPHAPMPDFVRTPQDSDAPTRFDVYRNNVHASLIDALLAVFPVTARLVSEESFRVLARAYLRTDLPQHAALHDYGAGLPDFLPGFDADASPPYLPDVAMLELLWWQSEGAADAMPPGAQSLALLDGTQLLSMRAHLHPATRLLASSHPVHAIWAAHQQHGDPAPPSHWDAECVLITRPDAQVQVQDIDIATHAFIASLGKGATLEQAALAALDLDPSFDLGATLLRITAAGALLELQR
jgi:hypothetical protein